MRMIIEDDKFTEKYNSKDKRFWDNKSKFKNIEQNLNLRLKTTKNFKIKYGSYFNLNNQKKLIILQV